MPRVTVHVQVGEYPNRLEDVTISLPISENMMQDVDAFSPIDGGNLEVKQCFFTLVMMW